jgi:hypothetical protein
VTTGFDAIVARVGGEKNAALLAGGLGVAGVWFLGRRKAAKSQTAPVSVMAQGYANTAQDPTALYTGYDQLQQEIDNLRQQPGAPNSNPVPGPTSPPSSTPVAPIPDPWSVAVANHQYDGTPLPTYAPTPAQQLGPAPGWTGGPPVHNGGGGGGGFSGIPFRHG